MKDTAQQKAQSIKIIWRLQSKFPHCFSASDPKPLKINIGTDILNAFQEPPFSKSELNAALNLYTSSPQYLKSCLNHMIRIDLEGNHVGVITDDEKRYAKQKYVESLRHLSTAQKEKTLQKPWKKLTLNKPRAQKVPQKPQKDLFDDSPS